MDEVRPQTRNTSGLRRGNAEETSLRGPSCPSCKATASVVKDSRQHHEEDGSTYVRRRRLCINCNNRFTTFEYSSRISTIPKDTIRGLRSLRAEIDRILSLPSVTYGDKD